MAENQVPISRLSPATTKLGKNAIINGDMRIAQRGGTFVAISGASNGTYCLDRWVYVKSSTAVHTVSQSAEVPTSDSFTSLKLDCTTADASVGAAEYVAITQRIEGYNFKKFVGQTATLSFWIRAGKTGTMCVSFRSGSADQSYIAEVTINSADTWEYKTITLDFDYAGGTWDYSSSTGLQIDFSLLMGSDRQSTAGSWLSGNYLATSNQTNFCDATDATCDVYITNVQLELGDAASDFESIDYSAAWGMCERYYQTQYYRRYKSGTAAGVAGTEYHTISLKTRMRTNATITYPGASTGGNVTIDLVLMTNGSMIEIRATSTGSYNNWVTATFYCDAEL